MDPRQRSRSRIHLYNFVRCRHHAPLCGRRIGNRGGHLLSVSMYITSLRSLQAVGRTESDGRIGHYARNGPSSESRCAPIDLVLQASPSVSMTVCVISWMYQNLPTRLAVLIDWSSMRKPRTIATVRTSLLVTKAQWWQYPTDQYGRYNGHCTARHHWAQGASQPELRQVHAFAATLAANLRRAFATGQERQHLPVLNTILGKCC